ncbi:hypothetical protein K435DRAFT_566590, partial [Dendrothele bispora CBS 962.96]
QFTPPAELRHLPRVPILPLLWSFVKGEVEDVSIKRLTVPFAKQQKEGIARDLSADIETWQKEESPDESLLWRFVGRTNVILSNGSSWKRHSHVVRSALGHTIPIGDFVTLAHKLFGVMGQGGCLKWDDLTMRFTLDAVGTTTFGHDFKAISEMESPFVRDYNSVMESIASVPYIVFPILERLLPRPAVIKKIDLLVSMFSQILEEKKHNKGDDMLTFMLEDPEISDIEFRDNMVVFFIAGH